MSGYQASLQHDDQGPNRGTVEMVCLTTGYVRETSFSATALRRQQDDASSRTLLPARVRSSLASYWKAAWFAANVVKKLLAGHGTSTRCAQR